MQVAAIRGVYDIIFQIHSEYKKAYVPDAHLRLIAPALEKISAEFAKNEISVAELAALCNDK